MGWSGKCAGLIFGAGVGICDAGGGGAASTAGVPAVAGDATEGFRSDCSSAGVGTAAEFSGGKCEIDVLAVVDDSGGVEVGTVAKDRVKTPRD